MRMRGGAAVTAPHDQVHYYITHIIEDRPKCKTVKYDGPKGALPKDGASEIMGLLKLGQSSSTVHNRRSPSMI